MKSKMGNELQFQQYSVQACRTVKWLHHKMTDFSHSAQPVTTQHPRL